MPGCASAGNNPSSIFVVCYRSCPLLYILTLESSADWGARRVYTCWGDVECTRDESGVGHALFYLGRTNAALCTCLHLTYMELDTSLLWLPCI